MNIAHAHVLLCATDLSEGARDAIDTAIELSGCVGAGRIHVLHVREGEERIESLERTVLSEAEENERLRGIVREELAHVSTVRGSPIRAEVVSEIRVGKPYLEIVRYALDVAADVIIVGTHGRTGWRHALGSVAEQVVRHAPCNVVVAKPPTVCEQLARAVRATI
jgi:nucleotide-binding universal stress UspA family protein